MRLAAALSALLVFSAAALAGEIRVSELPPEARDTLQLIGKGGPYPYPQDGHAFHNRERRLPLRSAGYYTEFTVQTPGARGRGARRIVTGQGGELYYTADHYGSFKRIMLE